MTGGKDNGKKRNKNRLRQWVSILAIPVFLAGTALFSFLWNVPMDKLAAPRAADAPVAVLFREPCSPAVRTISKDSSLHPSIFCLIKNYVGTVTNAGRLDFSSHVPQEVEIRMEGLSIGLSPSLAVFNFRTKYGFSMQTSRKPDASDRAIYQWMKNRMKAEKREK
ncbi:hypothetical protein [uncultured Akkermansia sp.]|uniref:hypothetical protein n=1 Tax=uncultured Akkermansia sp. TaxID=512294 RepID=UPI0025915F44|nr:hypothetical protein [uncultured Akkermansia sp.]